VKAHNHLVWAAAIALFSGAGCANSHLTVKVDLYRFNEANRVGFNLMERLHAAEQRVGLLENDIAVMVIHYKAAVSNLYAAKSEQALNSGQKEKAIADLIRRDRENLKVLLSGADTFADQANRANKELRGSIRDAREKCRLLRSPGADPGSGRYEEAAVLGPVYRALEKVQNIVRYELEPQPEGSTRQQQLAIGLVGDELDKIKDGKAKRLVEEALETTQEKGEASKSDANQIAAYLLGGASINPDMLADDSDPFYQVIASDRTTPAWSTNFFTQSASADGKVSFLIVRETPVRFTMNEAKANPAVLIKTQLRSARAGIKTIATIAKAMNPAIGAALGGVQTAGGGGGAAPVAAGAAPAPAPGSPTGDLLARISSRLNEFESSFEAHRTTATDAIHKQTSDLDLLNAEAETLRGNRDAKSRARDDARVVVEEAHGKVEESGKSLAEKEKLLQDASQDLTNKSAELEAAKQAFAAEPASAEKKKRVDDLSAAVTMVEAEVGAMEVARKDAMIAKDAAANNLKQPSDALALREMELAEAERHLQEVNDSLGKGRRELDEALRDLNAWVNRAFVEKLKGDLDESAKNLEAIVKAATGTD
jgi:hypothetical protein